MLSIRSLLFIAVVAACAARPETKPWRLELTSSGGFTGRGAGTWVLESTGALKVTTPQGSSCAFHVPDKTLRTIAAALASRSNWGQHYMPKETCCDRVTWELAVDVGGETSKTEWMQVLKEMPKELSTMVETLDKLRTDNICRTPT
jgi:hypothetical protein